MRPILFICAIAGLGLSACQQPETQGSLELACQVKACSCIGPRTSIVGAPQVQEVLWKQNGEAYCAEGFRLEPDDSKSKKWTTNYGG
ncbi:MAG: hypothetical protein AAF495_17145 [Pseudomonadota bacterium]